MSILKELSRPFPASQVKTRNQAGLDLQYVSIDDVINRFNEVLDNNWSSEVEPERLQSVGPNSKGKEQYLAQAKVTITLLTEDGRPDCWRAGVGAHIHVDPDMAIKTSQAEAFKKAANQFGVALELWDPARRALNTLAKEIYSIDTQGLKNGINRAAREAGVDPKTFLLNLGLAEEALSSEAAIRGCIAEAAGVSDEE